MSVDNSLTIFPYEPFKLDFGINILNFQNQDEYSKIIFNLYQLRDKIRLFDDPDQFMHFYVDNKLQKSTQKEMDFIGSLQTYSINSMPNLKLVYKKIAQSSNVEFKDAFEKINVELNELVFDAGCSFDGPFDYDSLSTFESILKFKSLKFDSGNWQNYYDKMLAVINFYKDFSEKRLLILHDLHKLLNLNQVNEMNDYLRSLKLTLISFESYEMISRTENLNCKVYSIDDDHMRFDY
ncbi:type II-A CRISPR-associated protein Csn2 [Companilactobacillus mishanensis]|uniref:Type II-A CRISPR-associated protein Csn2 n=1 Tax=Companilactobacillus mishanensis TaxID=2486008 RepID=A0A5P0ZKA1_9LACO|nr:type II-A CRISPR-associated protein Csn2 [Companilactobacillus mishanensis]MQS53509.1 type II-A CRISPR-associated protein Csn2 [Companilactobacillus mishanensis]